MKTEIGKKKANRAPNKMITAKKFLKENTSKDVDNCNSISNAH